MSQPGTKAAAAGMATDDGQVAQKAPSLQPFRFLDLPVDIRFLIYETHLTYRRGLVRLFNRVDPFHGMIKPVNLGINLLLTCRQIHREGSRLLYQSNTFCILPRVWVEMRPICERSCNANSKISLCGKIRKNKPTQTLEKMGQKNRGNIRKIEIMIPDSTYVCIDHLRSLADWFPHTLQSCVLFFDSTVARREYYPRGQTGKIAYQTYYEEFAKLVPVPTSVDFSLFDGRDTNSYAPLHSAIAQAFETGIDTCQPKSIFCTKELEDYQKYRDHKIEPVEDFLDLDDDSEPDWSSQSSYWGTRKRLAGDCTDDESVDGTRGAVLGFINVVTKPAKRYDGLETGHRRSRRV